MGFPAARLSDTMMHGPPLLGSPCPTVLIGSMPAWQGTGQHTCTIPNTPPPAGPGTPHGPGITVSVTTVLIGKLPAARQTDKVIEAGAVMPPMITNIIMMGCLTVLVG